MNTVLLPQIENFQTLFSQREIACVVTLLHWAADGLQCSTETRQAL
jgi:hypothetical protein